MRDGGEHGQILVIDPDWMLFPIVFRAVLGLLVMFLAAGFALIATGTGAAGQLALDLVFWQIGATASPTFAVLAIATALSGAWITWTALRTYVRRHELIIDLQRDRIVLRGRYLGRPSSIVALSLGMIGQDDHYSDLAYHQVLARLKDDGMLVLAVYMEAERAGEAGRRIAEFLGVAFDPARAALRRLW